jgi:hypothetical protein
MWIKTTGKLVYEPPRRNFNKTYKQKTLVAELPRDDLDLYYQWFLRKERGSWFSLATEMQEISDRNRENELQRTSRKIGSNIPGITRPMWGKHVTVVRGDELGHESAAWKKHAGRKVDIMYLPEAKFTHGFWSLPVMKTDELRELRTELGLTREYNFHITIARQLNWTFQPTYRGAS